MARRHVELSVVAFVALLSLASILHCMINRPIRRDRYLAAARIALCLLLPGLHPPGGQAGELSEITNLSSPRELNLPDLFGQQRSLDEFSSKVLLVNFWASWCTPCLEEMPGIQRLAGILRDKPFAVIGVNVGETQRRVQVTAKRLDIEFTVLLDRDSTVFKDWGASVLPTSYILDRDGRVRYLGLGPLEWDRGDIVKLLQELLTEKRLND